MLIYFTSGIFISFTSTISIMMMEIGERERERERACFACSHNIFYKWEKVVCLLVISVSSTINLMMMENM